MVGGCRDGRLGAGVLRSAPVKAETSGNRSAGSRSSARSTAASVACRHRGAHRTDRAGRLRQAAGHDGLGGGTGKRGLTDQHLVEDARQAVLVAPGIHRLRARLFGTHVDRRADREAGAGEALAAGLDQRLGDSEIGDVHVPAGEQQVLGLDVAVNDPFAVRGAERRGRFLDDVQGLLDRQVPLAVEAAAQRFPGNVGHGIPGQRDPLGTREHAGIQHGNDVGVLESPCEPDFPDESVHADRTRQLGTQNLDRDRSIVATVPGQPHGRHAAPAELALHRVPIGKHLVQKRRARRVSVWRE